MTREWLQALGALAISFALLAFALIVSIQADNDWIDDSRQYPPPSFMPHDTKEVVDEVHHIDTGLFSTEGEPPRLVCGGEDVGPLSELSKEDILGILVYGRWQEVCRRALQ